MRARHPVITAMPAAVRVVLVCREQTCTTRNFPQRGGEGRQMNALVMSLLYEEV